MSATAKHSVCFLQGNSDVWRSVQNRISSNMDSSADQHRTIQQSIPYPDHISQESLYLSHNDCSSQNPLYKNLRSYELQGCNPHSGILRDTHRVHHNSDEAHRNRTILFFHPELSHPYA